MITRVYEYGLLPPVEGAELVREQLRLSHDYYNRLIEIERQTRAEIRAVLSSYRDVEAIQAQIDSVLEELKAVREEINRHKSRTRSGAVAAERRAKARGLRAQLKVLRKELRETKQRIAKDEEAQRRIAEIRERAKELRRQARAESGLYWGTYQLVEAAADDAAKKTKRDNPKFKRWAGEGSVSVQIIGGLPTSDVFGQHTQVRIDPVPESAWTSPRRGERRRLARTRLHLRVGSDGREPVWAVWPMVMHRPLPEGRIKRVTVHLRHIADRARWVAQVIVDEPETPPKRPGVVAVDVGWRLIDGDVRVAYAVGDNGWTEELRLPKSLFDYYTYPDQLRSIRDTYLNEIRGTLAAWRAAGDRPEWWREATMHLHRWRSPTRFVVLWRMWMDKRFDGDEDMFDALTRWRHKDRHLWQWERRQKHRAMGQRREIYRRWAAKLAARYGTIVLESLDLRRFARKPAPEEGTATSLPYDYVRTFAAVHTLRSVLKNTRGVQWIEVDATNSTRDCHHCGCTEEWNQEREVIHRCAGCGLEWDQDENAARNLLARGLAVLSSPEVLKKVEQRYQPRIGRWSRLAPKNHEAEAVET